jgi:hypothetical protein
LMCLLGLENLESLGPDPSQSAEGTDSEVT